MENEINKKRTIKELETIMSSEFINIVKDICVELYNINFKGEIHQNFIIEEECNNEVKFELIIKRIKNIN